MAKTKATKATKATKCPITREQFIAEGKPLLVQIDGKDAVAGRKEFSTGSFGWHANEKMVLSVNGTPVKVQANILLTVVGSKEAE